MRSRSGRRPCGRRVFLAASGGSRRERRRTCTFPGLIPVTVLYRSAVAQFQAGEPALEVAGIDRDTPDPEGGIIERDQDGDPTGLLRETANAMVASVIPPASDAQKMQGMKIATDEMLAHGITSFTARHRELPRRVWRAVEVPPVRGLRK